jgi:hypothetical protein
MKRRTEIKIEIERSLIIRRPEAEAIAWCAECAARVQMLKPEDAAVVARVSVRTIYRWVEAGKLHFSETPEGPNGPNAMLRICLNSLMRDRQS